jgi:CIC family chloride channel protein
MSACELTRVEDKSSRDPTEQENRMGPPEDQPAPAPDRPSSPEDGPDIYEPGQLPRGYILPQALFVGLSTGALAVLFRVLLDRAEDLRTTLLLTVHPLGLVGYLLAAGLLTGVIGLAVWLVQRWCPQAAGSGIPLVKQVLEGRESMPGWWALGVKFASGLAAIGAGLCLGREGPLVQMGAIVGTLAAAGWRTSRQQGRALLVTGSAAGLAAAFNAPLAGVVFVLEELRIGLTSAGFYTAMVASITADLVTRLCLGQVVIFPIETPAPPLASLPLFVLLGVLGGLGGCAFNVGLLQGQRRLRSRSPLANVLKVLGCGLLITLVGWWAPEMIGGGMTLSRDVLAGSHVASWLIAALLLRFVLSIGSYAMGSSGGIFAPLLVLGAIGGELVGLGVQEAAGSAVPPLAFAVGGMAALFAGVVRAPLTGIVLLIEMTGNYNLALSLMIASFTATAVADVMRVPPIYDALAREKPESSSSQAIR